MSSVLRHIAKHSAIYASADILAKVVGFALLPLYTRKFSAAEYGILALILLFNTVPGRFITQLRSTPMSWNTRATARETDHPA